MAKPVADEFILRPVDDQARQGHVNPDRTVDASTVKPCCVEYVEEGASFNHREPRAPSRPMKSDLHQEMGIKIRLNRSDEQIIHELVREGFAYEDIVALLPLVRQQSRTSWQWLLGPLWKCSACGMIASVLLWTFFKAKFPWPLIHAAALASLFMTVTGAIIMSRAMEGHGSWMNVFKPGGWVLDVAELEGDDKKRYGEGFVILGIGICSLFVIPFILTTVFPIASG